MFVIIPATIKLPVGEPEVTLERSGNLNPVAPPPPGAWRHRTVRSAYIARSAPHGRVSKIGENAACVVQSLRPSTDEVFARSAVRTSPGLMAVGGAPPAALNVITIVPPKKLSMRFMGFAGGGATTQHS